MSSYRDRVPLAHRARGKWASILSDLGMDHRYLTGKQGPCPFCGGGKDRFRFDNKEGRGTFICNQCGAGDGCALVQRLKDCDFKTAAALVEERLEKASLVEPKPDRPEEQKRAAMNKVWLSSEPIQDSDPAGKYLWNRARVSVFPTCLRFNPRVVFDHEQNLRHPAMIAKVTAPDGKPCMLHRTYLTPEGQNLRVEGGNARRVMSGSIPKGSAIRLMPHDKVLGVAEGIETAFAASKMFDVPVWAALNAGLLADWEPPEGVEEVLVFGDCDPGFAGQAAAFSLARRLAGKRQIRTSVHIPPTIGSDFNDVFLATINQETAQ